MTNTMYLMIIAGCLCFANWRFSAAEETSIMNTDKSVKTNPIVVIKTNLGEMKAELYADKAPITVKNFLQYLTEGQYDHTVFHRVIPGFMIQGGGFTQDLKQKATHAPIQNEADNGLLNLRGTLAMARTSDVNSATSQFFINVVDNPFLNFKEKSSAGYGYCVFGKITEGMAVADKISKVAAATQGGHQNVPVQPVEIVSISLQPVGADKK